ncbi:MAG: hypothetical protein ACLFVO_11170 [Chloroflexaceae bacterium]
MLKRPATLRQRLDYLADDVESSSQGAAERLRDLGAAVEGEQAADTWAVADIFQLIDPDTIADQVRSRGGGSVRFLEVLRNVLIFMPIAVTWIGIWLALENYADVVAANPDLAAQAFLYLWQEGRLGVRLSTIALIDGILLAIVAILTFLVLAQNSQADRYADQVRDELSSVLADASLALTARRTRQTSGFLSQFDYAAQELLNELRQERMRVQELAERKEKEVGDLSTFIRDFVTGTQGMLTAAQSLHQIPMQQGRILNSLSDAFNQLADQQRDQQQEFANTIRQATAQLRLLTDTYRTTSIDMQGMGTNLQTMGSSFQTMGIDLRDAVNTFAHAATQSTQAVTDMRTSAGDLAAAQAQFLAAVAHERRMLERWTQEMQAAVQSLQQINRAIEENLAQVPPEAER